MYSNFSFSFVCFFLAFNSILLFGQSDYKILSSNEQSITFEFSLSGLDTSTLSITGKNFKKIDFKNSDFSRLNEGDMKLASRYFQIGVPQVEGCAVTVLSVETKEFAGVLPPVPKAVRSKGETFYEASFNDVYTKQELFPKEFASIASSGSIRSLPYINLKLNPVQCNPLERKIIVCTKMRVRVDFPKLSSTSFGAGREDVFLKGAVINYPAAKKFIKDESVALNKITAVSSVLSSGKWVRFETPEEGIYKISYDMLKTMGFTPASIDPKNIKIYNNSGKVLSETVAGARPTDLNEVAITVIGESDGKFDAGDYIMFYGRGVNFWEYDSVAATFKRMSNPYSLVNYYWITADGNPGKRVASQPSLKETSASLVDTITTTSAFAHWDVDRINIGKTGRIFLGDEYTMTNQSRTYLTPLEGLMPNTSLNYTYRFINSFSGAVKLDVSESGTKLESRYLSGTGSDEYQVGTATSSSFIHTGFSSGSQSSLQFTFYSGDAAGHGYLDYFEISYRRNLKPLNDNLTFYSNKATKISEFQLMNFSSTNIKVYNVTDYANISEITSPVRQSGSEFSFQSAPSTTNVAKYIAVGENGYKSPKNFVSMSNQNLRGISDGAVYIIVTPSEFVEQANRLADFRRTKSQVPLSSVVVKMEDIYNEFSGGVKDVTALRDFLRYAYLNWKTKPFYVLLLGHGDYDFRNIEGYNNNYIFPFESQESLHEINSFNQDDYFARIDSDDNSIDLAMGRLPVLNKAGATICVDKIIAYETSSDKNAWRNLLTLAADDGVRSKSNYPELDHTRQSEELSSLIPNSFDQKKIYLAYYPMVVTSFGKRKPEVNEAIIRAINEGTLILNYVGHGSPELWAYEQVFVKDITVPSLTNKNYFFLTAATCDFGYFDRPNATSSTEELLFKENGGAIGVFSSTRPVYSILNAEINKAFYGQLLAPDKDTLNLCYPLGYLYYQAKKYRSLDNDLKYHLFCDPALRLGMPRLSGSIDSINSSASNLTVTVKALGKMSIKGSIYLPTTKTVDKSFNGEGVLTVYDSKQLRGIPEYGTGYDMLAQGGVIFNGRVSVVNGEFSTSFIVPKDISYEGQNGKIVFYFYQNNSDGLAFTSNILISGSDSTVINDGKGPEITVAFDDPARTDAYLIKPNSTLFASLVDETGLNTAGTGLGRQMKGILDGDDANPIDFTTYFSGDLNSAGKSGKITYRFDGLSNGEHSLKVDVYDIFNNPSSKTTFFKVDDAEGLLLEDVYNYPNPFSNNTYFLGNYYNVGPVSIKIKIYSISGRLIQQIEQIVKSSGGSGTFRIPWNGRDKEGNTIANGIYLYKVIISSLSGNEVKNITKKLAIMH